MMFGEGWLGLHLFLIACISLHDLASLMADGAIQLPAWSDNYWRRIESETTTIMGLSLSDRGLLQQGVATYADCAGVELGYTYFAPSVPGNAKLTFELHYPDGRVEYESPGVNGAAAGYRLATLLDNLQRLHYAPLREAILKTLVYSIRQEHPSAIMIRAVLGRANLPTIREYRAGTRLSYELLDAYDFRFSSEPPPAEKH